MLVSSHVRSVELDAYRSPTMQKVDNLRAVHNNLLKVTRVYNTHSYDYPAQIQESLAGLSSSVQSQIQNLTLSPAERAQLESQTLAQQAVPQPKTLSHALSRAAVAVCNQSLL
jgi:hypothetical protein